jgi:DNA-binding NarL/FixJ family response regulator
VLRALGAPISQRRDGTEAVPAELRTLGVTIREYEVGQLLADRLTNRAIGERLHISPRTVEKRIAALISKLAVPDRHAVIGRLTTPTFVHDPGEPDQYPMPSVPRKGATVGPARTRRSSVS